MQQQVGSQKDLWRVKTCGSSGWEQQQGGKGSSNRVCTRTLQNLQQQQQRQARQLQQCSHQMLMSTLQEQQLSGTRELGMCQLRQQQQRQEKC
jgi:hypothetical protein